MISGAGIGVAAGSGRPAGVGLCLAARCALDGDLCDIDGSILALWRRWVLLSVRGDVIELAVVVAVGVDDRCQRCRLVERLVELDTDVVRRPGTEQVRDADDLLLVLSGRVGS